MNCPNCACCEANCKPTKVIMEFGGTPCMAKSTKKTNNDDCPCCKSCDAGCIPSKVILEFKGD